MASDEESSPKLPPFYPAVHETAEVLTAEVAAMAIEDSQHKGTDPAEAAVIPPHRSHAPQNNMKRVDPFQFGSRYLQQEDNVFEFNAWDHVQTDDTYKEYAEVQYAKQREAPVSEFDKSKQQKLFFEFSFPRILMIYSNA